MGNFFLLTNVCVLFLIKILTKPKDEQSEGAYKIIVMTSVL